MKPISPIALLLWYYQQGTQLNSEERKQLSTWVSQSEERNVLFNDVIYKKQWLQLTLMQFLNQFETAIGQISGTLKQTNALNT